MKVLIALVVCGLIDVTRAEVCTVNPNAVNVALFGSVCQSSTFTSMPHPGPDRGVDGISETNHTIHTCVITNLDYEAYYRLDMQESYYIDQVQLVISSACWTCMNGAQIQVGDSPDRKNPVCATITGASQSQPLMTFVCQGMPGRYVDLVHAGRAGIISFCEIKVFSYTPPPQP